MKKYVMSFSIMVNVSVEVEAESKKEAIEEAKNKLYNDIQSGDFDWNGYDNVHVCDDVLEEDVCEIGTIPRYR